VLRHQATSSHATPRARDPDAALRCWLRHFGARLTARVQKAAHSITRKCNAFGANEGFEGHSGASTMATAAPPRHRRIADAPEPG
jgi:hypothetical protein